ncbi:hypothetical protein KBI5_11925 [Frankia sp. KB5]|nr:hypothetical protein KBI5_11925 [Frankia sp. KB5]
MRPVLPGHPRPSVGRCPSQAPAFGDPPPVGPISMGEDYREGYKEDDDVVPMVVLVVVLVLLALMVPGTPPTRPTPVNDH